MTPKPQEKQHGSCFMDTNIVWLSRLMTENEDSFMQLFSEETMEVHRKMKPLGTVRMRFFEDHIEFKATGIFSGKPPRNKLTYQQIDRFISTQAHPSILNLGIKDNDGKSMICEMMRFKTAKLLDQACDLIQKAKQHPKYKLIVNDTSNMLNTLSKISQNSLCEATFDKKGHGGGKIPVEMIENEDYILDGQPEHLVVKQAIPTMAMEQKQMEEIIPVEMAKVNQRPSIKHHHSQRQNGHNLSMTSSGLSQVPHTEEISYRAGNCQPIRNWHPEDIETLKQDLTKTVQDGSAWSVDVQTIENHPLYGNRISANGSIYMFIAHMIPENQREYSACSSSTGSLNSIDEYQMRPNGHEFRQG